jgi:PTS system nitrogen regulatory IIA component
MTIGDRSGPTMSLMGYVLPTRPSFSRSWRGGPAPRYLSTSARYWMRCRRARILDRPGLGKGFALPHARLDVLTRFFALFVRLARPIDFASIDGLPVNLMILLLTPANAGNQHLATLAALARPLRNEAFVQRLRQAPDATALHKLLAEP